MGNNSARSLIEILGLEAMDQATAPTFSTLLQKLYDARFQGAVTLHFAGGLPRSLTLSQPVAVPLDTAPPRKP